MKPNAPRKPVAVPPSIERTVSDMPLMLREAQIVPASFNADANTVDCVWTTGIRRLMYDWTTDQVVDEELVVSADAVDMTRFDAGAVQVLDDHDTWTGVGAILGRATRGAIEGSKGTATLALSTDPAKAGVVGDIKAGIIRTMSFGYAVQKYEVTPAQGRTDGGTRPLYRAVKWQPYELSFRQRAGRSDGGHARRRRRAKTFTALARRAVRVHPGCRPTFRGNHHDRS
jgi:hypothetical protein